MKKILLYIWQLPQNLLAIILSWILLIKHKKIATTKYKGITYLWFDKWNNGVSLGNYVILGTYFLDKNDAINHEYGHTVQSRILGPLYLLTVGIISGCGNLIDRWFHTQKYGWSNEKSYRWYYSQFVEKWADKCGKVQRNF